jgi:glycosyltransferase involved in cell wall biosynthesis
MSGPRISIITPSFNQAEYLEQTILSVLEQGYPDLEYMVIDGGSTDGSVDIIRKYASRLAYWVCEKDRGQTHAINKGMSRATGQILAYLNSDDIYLPGTLQRVADAWSSHPEADLIHGDCRIVDRRGNPIDRRRPGISNYEEALDVWGFWWKRRNFVQPEVFWTRRIADAIGPLREELHMVMDYDYWVRILRAGGKVVPIAEELAAFRITPTQKSTQGERAADEILQVACRELWDPSAPLRGSVRWRLQAQWLYQVEFLGATQAAVARGEPRWLRWIGGLGTAMRHPKLLLAAEYRKRIAAAALRTKA